MAGLAEEIQGWFAGRVPEDWYAGPAEVTLDREEILVVGTLPDVEMPRGSPKEEKSAARAGRIARHREDTRAIRMRIAEEAQSRFRRRVSWGAVCGDARQLFTHLSAPVMTRLRMPERAVLDTLVDAGVARSRSEALAWCVRLVGQHQADWIQQLRDALVDVERVRAEGPAA